MSRLLIGNVSMDPNHMFPIAHELRNEMAGPLSRVLEAEAEAHAELDVVPL